MKEKMPKQPPPAPTASTIGPCPTIIQISRTPWHRKFNQDRRTTRPPTPSVRIRLIVSEDFTTSLPCQTRLPFFVLKVNIGLSGRITFHILSWKPADFIHSVYFIYFIANFHSILTLLKLRKTEDKYLF